MKKYSKLIIAAIIALIFIGTFVFLWQKSQPKEIVYSEFTPKMDSIQKTTIITGKIEPRNEVNIKPQISGIISELYKQPGDYVNAGDVIAKVKVIPDMGSLSSAESRVRLAEINLQQAQVDYNREENLHNQKLVSDDEFDKSRQSLRQAQEEKKAAIDAREQAKKDKEKAREEARKEREKQKKEQAAQREEARKQQAKQREEERKRKEEERKNKQKAKN